MEDNKKYYTPTVEEFHIGFEFEYLTLRDGAATWIADTYGKVVTSSYLLRQVMKTGVRVKHLDKEDIESLGWEYQGDDRDGRNLSFYEKGKFILNDYRPYEYEDIKIYVSRIHAQTLFNGIIRNKSELKRIMAMIGIES